jgi:uncharacterized membrane protein YphA (DoxX/SURF4 family)
MNTQAQGREAVPAGSEPVPASEDTVEPQPWKLVTRIGFRFSVAYLILYAFPFPLDSLPFGNLLATHWANLWRAVVPWVGEHVLHLSYKIVIFGNGSGDTTFGYVKILCYVVLAIAATTVWSLVDRRRNYVRCYPWVQLYVRILLGATLLSYGAAKVIPTQMPEPALSRLLTTCGDSAPMSMLWTVMGASKSYEIFTGLVEMLGGILLFVPQLATLGALISTAATANVFLLNMSYDVPVKILSFHLLLMSLWLLLPETKRLVSFLILNRDVKHQATAPFFQRKWLNTSMLVAQLLFGLYLIAASLNDSYHVAKKTGFLAPKPPLYGIWMVEEFSINGGASARLDDPMRWQRVIVDNNLVVAFQSVSGQWQRLIHQTDMQKKTITLWRRQSWLERGKGQEMQIGFDRLPTDVITLDGKLDGKQIHAKLHHVPEPRFLLNTRGFHWINEYPFNGYDE